MEYRPRLTYLAPRDVAIPRVARQCMMRFCESLAKRGADVTLLALGVRLEFDEPTRSRDLWDVYGVEHRFRVRILPTRLRQSSPDSAITRRRAVRYAAAMAGRALRGEFPKGSTTTLYFRNPGVATALRPLRSILGSRLRLVLEAHSPPRQRDARILRGLDGVVCISAELAGDVTARVGVDPRRVLVAHTGVDVERIERLRLSPVEARAQLGLPGDGRLVVYTGKVHRDAREIHLLLETARHLPADVTLVIVGGREDQVEELRARLAREGPSNVRLSGFVAPSEVHVYQFAADALVMYYPREIAYNDYRSPAKLFEYLASGVPLVAADYRSMHEIVDGDNGILVPPERPDLLAGEIASLLGDPDRMARIGAAGRRTAAEHTWDARAEKVLRFLESLPVRS
ncbi:MAG: glycosyltransferase [Actinobacteria bacterium]|nr:glycosyltransferase [Actinomycetota bacterium]